MKNTLKILLVVSMCMCIWSLEATLPLDSLYHSFYTNPVFTLEDKFAHYMQHFGKRYDHARDRLYRMKVFEDNLRHIEHMNKKNTQKVYGITPFLDYTPEEFRSLFLKRDIKKKQPTKYALLRNKENNSHLADMNMCSVKIRFPELCQNDKMDVSSSSLDWRNYKNMSAVSEVKNQGMCGSCWSFGATSDIEGAWFMAGHPLVSLSEQQLVSCDGVDLGCNGGLQQNAFDYIKSIGGIMGEEEYPYVSGDAKMPQCHMSKNRFAAHIDDWVQVSDVDDAFQTEDQIKEYVRKNGPVTIGINASPMQFYMGGIHEPNDFECPAELNHAVTIIGYDSEDGINYWIIKNSWGRMWGEKGYYRVIRGKNACGLANDVVHSIVKPSFDVQLSPLKLQL